MPICTPNIEELKIIEERWSEGLSKKQLESPYYGELALQKLFSTFPRNVEIDEVYMKVVLLNTVYSTRIRSIDFFKVSEGILKIDDVDNRLRSGDLSLVDEIAKGHNVVTKKSTVYNFYSFATKYCSFSNPNDFPIYDSRVDEALWHFKKTGQMKSFKRQDLKCYKNFCVIISNFQKEFGLDNFTLKTIDRYLWEVGEKLISFK
jgi:hypothetical protein